jgi:hypothetical protein
MILKTLNVILIRKLTVTLDCTMYSVFFCNVNSTSTSAQVGNLLKLYSYNVHAHYCTLYIVHYDPSIHSVH